MPALVYKTSFQMTGFRFGILLMAAALPLLAASCAGRNGNDGDAQGTETPDEVQVPAIGFFTDRYDSDTVSVKYGDTFSVLMQRLGMSGQDAYALTGMCDSIIDLRRIKAGNTLAAFYETTDSSRTLKYVVYDHDLVHSTVFNCDSLAVWNYDKPVEHVRRSADVTISSSLWNDMIDAGASPALIMNLADIYQWSINFFTLQKGDRFRILYTQSECEGQLVGIDSVRFSLFDGCDGKQVAAVLFDTGEGGSNTYWDKGGVSLKRMFLKAPLRYNRISSRFSYRRKHPVTGKIKAHTAVDYAAPTGTEVYAIGDGTVTKCGWDPTGGGNRIRIKHMQGYESSYMHLSRFASGIRVGTRVSQGQLIGYVGATGTATGPHLDFRIWERGRPIDPLTLNSPASEPLDTAYLSEFNALYESYMREVGATPAACTVSAPQVGEATATDGRAAGIAPGSASGPES